MDDKVVKKYHLFKFDFMWTAESDDTYSKNYVVLSFWPFVISSSSYHMTAESGVTYFKN